MQQNITIKYIDGTETTYQVRPPDYAKWEMTTKKVISQFGGMYDILYVAHSAMKREAGGKPVKLLLEHDRTRPIGKMVSHNVTKSGIEATFKIANTMAGEDALVEATEGLRDGFSVGAQINEWTNNKGVMQITSATLDEVSLVTDPAIDSARVSEVAASENEAPKEDFSIVDELIQTNIFSGHQVTTPSIFGIAVPGKLGTRTEMRDGYEIFKSTYVNGKQMFLESAFNMLAGYAGYPEDLTILSTEPIGIEFSEATILQVAPKEWIIEKLGIDMSKYQQPEQPIQQPVETAEQFDQHFDFSSLDDLGDDEENYIIWRKRSAFEMQENFADVSQLQANILDLISKDKRITPEVIASVLKEDVGTIKRIMGLLADKGYIAVKDILIGEGIDSNIITERQLTEPLRDIVEKIKPETTQLLVRYTYEWKKGFNDSDKPSSRPFCQYMINQRVNNKKRMYSRSEIEEMSSRLGYSVWDRLGGWWTKPNGKHSPSCRHEWKENIVTRK